MTLYQYLSKKLLPNEDIRPLGFLLSLIIAFIWFCYQQPINYDGIIYLHAANQLLQHGLKASIHTFDWPFYPVLIALVSKITHLSLLNAGYLLDAILIGLIIVAFISVIRTLGAPKVIQYIACFVILCYTSIGHERFRILRDYGYYAFGLFALNELLVYQVSSRYKNLLKWCSFTILAGLFRLEGFFFLLLAPFVFLLDNRFTCKDRCLSFIKANSILICLSIIAIIGVLLSSNHNSVSLVLKLASERMVSSIHQLSSSYYHSISILQKYILSPFGHDQASYYYFSAPLGIFTALLIQSISYVYAILILYSQIFKVFKIKKEFKIIIWSYIIINVLVLLAFLYANLFLTVRYMIFLALILILQVPYAIYDIYKRYPSLLTKPSSWRWQPAVLTLAMIILVISTLFHIGSNKSFIIHAGNWSNKNISAHKTVLVNSNILEFYVKHPGKIDRSLIEKINKNPILANEEIKKFEFIVLDVNSWQINKVLKFIKEYNYKIIKTFVSNRKDRIFIVEVKI